jgi:hypothetical protein
MKKLGVFASMLILGIIASQLNAQAQCDNATMSGTYVMSASGTVDGVPIAVIAKVTYDGHGNGSALETVSLGGTIYADVAATGTFAVNSDCTGTKEFKSPLGNSNYSFVITPDGGRITWIETDTGTTLNGVALRFPDKQKARWTNELSSN